MHVRTLFSSMAIFKVLSLTKQIVLQHHGRIDVKSQKWKGTTFIVSLPLGDQHLQPIEKIYNRNDWGDIYKRSKLYQVDLETIADITTENSKQVFGV